MDPKHVPEEVAGEKDFSDSEETFSDDYDSAEDSPYRPIPCESSDEEDVVECSRKKGKQQRRKGKQQRQRMKKQPACLDSDWELSDELDYGIGSPLPQERQPSAVEENFDEDLNFEYQSEELHSPIASDDDERGDRPVFPQFNEEANFGNVNLELGMEFTTLQQFKTVVKDYNIHLGREVIWKKNDKIRCRAKCGNPTCRWEIYCARSSVTNSFQIKTFNMEHTCSRQFQNRQASQGWVVHKLCQKLRTQPNLKHREAFELMKTEYCVHLNDTKIFRSLKKAREIVEGNEREQYSRLWDYCAELIRSNPSSTVKMNTIPCLIPNSPPQFERLYICLEGCKRAFKAGCRPFIGLDGCFLKGYLGGQLLSAVGQDANKHLVVIAYAVVDIENKDNWKWFLTLLHEDLGDFREHGWTFVSDQQKV